MKSSGVVGVWSSIRKGEFNRGFCIFEVKYFAYAGVVCSYTQP